MVSCYVNTFNLDLVLGVAHGAQAVVYMVLAFAADRPSRFLVTHGTPETYPGNLTIHLGNATEGYITKDYALANPGAALAIAFFITSIAHFIRAFLNPIHNPCCGLRNTARVRSKSSSSLSAAGDDQLKKQADARYGDRMCRWIEYSITSTIMIVLILLQVGISDIFALIGNAGANAAMVLLGAAGDLTKPLFWPKLNIFIYGCIVGVTPWISIFWQISMLPSLTTIVWVIVFAMFFLFLSFAVAEFVYVWSFPVSAPKDGSIKQETSGETLREGVEFTYQILSAISKTLLGALIAGASLSIGLKGYVNTM